MNIFQNRILLMSGAAVLALILIYAFFLKDTSPDVIYSMASVDKGDIKSYVRATGTINPVTTAEIGTQFSGIAKKVFVDFNSKVKAGDPLVQLDPKPFAAKVNSAGANLNKAKAEAELALGLYQGNKELFSKRLISKQEFSDSKAKYASAKASVEQAEAALTLENANLESTTLRSPIDGIVISRKVNVGQALFPGDPSKHLFLIAEDIARMQLSTHVSEADIGRVKEGQTTTFTVDAYRKETFKGKVLQVRNEPITENNVVTYNVIILVNNDDLKLKPGMTAAVSLLTAEKKNAPRVPKEALRFLPPPLARMDEKSKNIYGRNVVWIKVKMNMISAVPITTGISDEYFIEILEGSDLKEGQKVIVAATQTRSAEGNNLGPLKLPQPKRF